MCSFLTAHQHIHCLFCQAVRCTAYVQFLVWSYAYSPWPWYYGLGLKVLGLGLDGWGRDYITEVDGQWQLNQDHPQLCWPLVRVQLKPVFSLANNSYIRMTVITSQSVETLTELCRKRHPLWFPQTPASAGHTLHHLDNTEYCVCIIFGLNSTMTALHAARIHVYDVCMYMLCIRYMY